MLEFQNVFACLQCAQQISTEENDFARFIYKQTTKDEMLANDCIS
jgi:hypothetical protein